MATVLRTLVLSIPIVIAVGMLRPAPRSEVAHSGVHRKRFWAQKASIRGSVRIALAGDSRVYQGLSPDEIARTLAADGRDSGAIHNLGFSGVCLCGPYLAYVERALAPGSPRMVVLGITPHSLTEHAANANGYLSELARPRAEVLERTYLAPLFDFLEPISLDTLRGTKDDDERYRAHYWPDGWVSATPIGRQDPSAAVHEYRPTFTTFKVSAALVDALVDTIARWRADGVAIVAFRPPVSAEMRHLEDELAGYDEETLRSRLGKVGAAYLAFDDARYTSYDGSHLEETSARALSRDLAAHLPR